MINRVDVCTTGWADYELIDSGEGRKLERFGEVILDRPDPQALWKQETPSRWQEAHARFEWGEKEERWKLQKEIPAQWMVRWNDVALALSLKEFKHVGLFPEHASQWELIQHVCTSISGQKKIRVLNLFGYTGAASVVAAHAGALVTHVDASKHAIEMVKENAARSGLAPDAIRTITEDALKYAKRLVQRGEQFEIIVMDPPAFGRGPKGEVWKIEEGLPELLALIPALLSEDARLVILNGYAAGFSARTFGELFEDIFKQKTQERNGEISYGDISLVQSSQQKNSSRLLATGIYAAWQA